MCHLDLKLNLSSLFFFQDTGFIAVKGSLGFSNSCAIGFRLLSSISEAAVLQANKNSAIL
jgi:hypothetical protein